MSSRILIPLACVVAAVVMATWRPWRSHDSPSQSSEATPASSPESAAPMAANGLRPASASGRSSNTFTALNPGGRGGTAGDGQEHLFDPELLESGDAAYRARVNRHVDLRHYYASPAKDTPECAQILDLLKREGASTNAVGDAYHAAWDYAHNREAMARANRGGEGEQLAKMFSEVAVSRLKLKHGLTNEAFFAALFQIRPAIFFGRRDLNLPAPGEPLLE